MLNLQGPMTLVHFQTSGSQEHASTFPPESKPNFTAYFYPLPQKKKRSTATARSLWVAPRNNECDQYTGWLVEDCQLYMGPRSRKFCAPGPLGSANVPATQTTQFVRLYDTEGVSGSK